MIITDITPGTIVLTVDKNGALVLAPVIAVSHTPVAASHKMSHLVLKDGRNLLVSPNHPTIDEKTVGQLKKGDLYDGSTVELNDLVNYTDGRTYDILPAGDTGFYFANGILLASTLKM